MRIQAFLRTALLLPLLWLSKPDVSQALQLVEASDGVTVEAALSIKEPTRIRIDGSPITNVFGNIYSSNCGGSAGLPPAAGAAAAVQPQTNPAGEVILECDADKGEIYVRPVGAGGKPVNLFVSSQQATYTLLLRRTDTPADTIVIRDRTPRAAPAANDSTYSGASTSHIRRLKALLVIMASDRVPSDIRVEQLEQPRKLWSEVQLTLVRTFEGRGLIGEQYRLTNVSGRDMVLAEQEFDRDGGRVLGVSIRNHNLRPGATTAVYVIRAGS